VRARYRIVVAADERVDRDGFARAVRKGLSRRPRQLPCRFFYDRAGSLLFEEICTLDEYYLPRAEAEILSRYGADIVGAMAPGSVLVELGSGSAQKTRLVIAALLARQRRLRYVPIDVSGSMLEESAAALSSDFPGIDVIGVAGEYTEGLQQLDLACGSDAPRLVLWLGSNIGNFRPTEAADFLAAVRARLRPGDRMLVGADLRKDRKTLERAYDDAAGVTARFNKNILARINRELDGEFDLDTFRHRAVWVEDAGRIEMHLDSVRVQDVRVGALGRSFAFAAGEPIHTEDSYKWSPPELEALLDAAGLRLERMYMDDARRFVDVLATVDRHGAASSPQLAP